MEMHDLAKKDMSMMEVSPTGAKSPVKRYPTLCLTEKQMPDLKGMKIGETFEMLMEATIKGIPRSYGNGDIEYDLDLQKCGMVKDEETVDDTGKV